MECRDFSADFSSFVVTIIFVGRQINSLLNVVILQLYNIHWKSSENALFCRLFVRVRGVHLRLNLMGQANTIIIVFPAGGII